MEKTESKISDVIDPVSDPVNWEEVRFIGVWNTNIIYVIGDVVQTVNGDEKIIDGVRVLLTPGHTAGGQSVAVETDSGTAVITGFCCVRQNFEPPEMLKEMLPMLMPGIYQNGPQLFDSMLKVKEVADIVIPLHESEYINTDRIT